jgi:S1-C subfamily serine protease
MNLEGPRPVNPEQGGYLLTPPPPAPTYTQQAPTPNYARRLTAAIIAAIVLATGGGIGIGWTAARLITNHATAITPIRTVSPAAPNTNTTLSAAAIAAKVDPAVVDINTQIQTTTGTSAAAGTGLILTSSGDILTNNHVVEGSISIKVTIQGRASTYSATVIGVNPGADLAVIHIDNISGLPTVTMADSSTLAVGDKVYAIGNALGLGGTPRMTQGAVTALNQTITASENGLNSETLTGMIQADAEISPGDSGGALVNSAGQVIGIITAGEAQGFRSTVSTVNYAIPSSTAVAIANQILARHAGNGNIIGPVGYLGVSVETLDSVTAGQLGLSISSGALVRGVQTGSPAEGAGITAGSVITQVNSTPIDSATSLGTALHQFKPGDHVKITWYASGGFHSATVTLISGPNV